MLIASSIVLNLEVVRTSETWVNFYRTIQLNAQKTAVRLFINVSDEKLRPYLVMLFQQDEYIILFNFGM